MRAESSTARIFLSIRYPLGPFEPPRGGDTSPEPHAVSTTEGPAFQVAAVPGFTGVLTPLESRPRARHHERGWLADASGHSSTGPPWCPSPVRRTGSGPG